jgi:phage tail-like protein
MSDQPVEQMPSSYFAVYDVLASNTVPPDQHWVANFDNLTGGEQQISMISYTQVDGNGVTLVRYIPGQVKYSPVLLLRAFDSKTYDQYLQFKTSVEGRLIRARKNFSIVMIDYEAGPQVIWNLENAIPMSITGFSFNQHKGDYYTDFEITFQPERIEMIIPS